MEAGPRADNDRVYVACTDDVTPRVGDPRDAESSGNFPATLDAAVGDHDDLDAGDRLEPG
jgi:hypothetical protein